MTVCPRKVNLTFDTAPSGLTLFLDGIAKTTPFVYDTLVGFQHSIDARNQTVPSGNATFASWSDGGAAAHTLTVPATDQGYTATYTVTPVSAPIAFVQVAAATPQTNQTAVPVALATAQVAGNLNAVVVGWNDVAANVASVTDTAGNTYLPAAPVTRGAGISQAVYYAANIAARRQHRDRHVRPPGGIRGRPRRRVQRPRPGEHPSTRRRRRPARQRRPTAGTRRRPRRGRCCSAPGRPPAASGRPAAATRRASSPSPTSTSSPTGP